MVSYIWRSTTASAGLGPRPTSGSELITFTKTNEDDGRHLRDTTLAWKIGFSENSRPKQGFNQIQDTGPRSLAFNITGHVEGPINNTILQTIKEWLLEGKTNDVFTKGRFGIELENIGVHDAVPTATGTTSPIRPEQARGLVLVNWDWIQSGAWPSKGDFDATFRFNGNHGVNTTTPKYDWTVIYT